MREILLAALTLAFGLVNPAFADVVYSVKIDTSSVNGSVGNLEFQFNGGAFSSQPATVKIDNFAGGSIGAGEQRSGDVSGGPLPSAVRINNTPNIDLTPGFNDYLTPFTYGNTLAFNVSFSGIAVTAPNSDLSGSTFAFSLWDANQQPVLVPSSDSNPGGFAFTVGVGDSSTPQLNNFMPTGSVVASVPEPEEYLMLLLGGGMVAFQVKRKQKRATLC